MNVVIVGAGPCGLYLALLFLSLSSSKNLPLHHITLIESEERVGGRTQMGNYNGQVVVAGAGVIRKKDKRLRRLCRQFKIPTTPFQTKVHYPHSHQSKSYFLSLLSSFQKKSSEFDLQQTFSQNFQRIMGKDLYNDFIEMAGYTDFEHANVWDSLRDYGWNDNTSGQTMYTVQWNDLTHNMAQYLHNKYPLQFKLLLNTTVNKVYHRNKKFHVSCLQKKKENINNINKINNINNINNIENIDIVVWTTPRPGWKPIQRFLPDELLKQVQCQPFLRAYATSKHPQQAKMLYPPHQVTHTRHDCCLQKVIPMSFSFPNDNLYMISYSDNEHAVQSNRFLMDRNMKKDWKNPKLFFWECGTHYFSPSRITSSEERETWLDRAVHPSPTLPLYIASEGLSTQQGWTEGALESAERAFRHILFDSF
jgi:hypothetical protein